MPATALAHKMSPEDMVGEIVERRYAVLEHLGVNQYLVYDMESMRRTVVPLGTDGSVLPGEPCPPAPPTPAPGPRAPARRDHRPTLAVVPPPIPQPPPVPTEPRRRVDTHRFEAAWFARGEQLQHEEEEAAEVTDYIDYQARLERLALELP